ncbi:MAG: ABC transporter ATP-binding protein [Bacillota bacterium]|nr:ABC transporter ATP-binding protein [Bacillota bacterium]
MKGGKIRGAAPGGPGGRGPGPGHGAALEKPKSVRKTLLTLWDHLGRRKGLVILAFLMVLINIVASLAGTAYLEPIIDEFLQPANGDLSLESRLAGLLHGLIVLGVIYAVSAAAAYVQMRVMISVTQRTIRDIRGELFDHLQTLPVRYYDSRTHGEMMSRFTNDVDTLNDALQNSLLSLLSSVITFAGILGLMLWRSLLLTAVTLLMAPVMFLILSKIMKASSKYFVAQQKNLGAVNGHIEEIMTGQKVVKSFCYEERAEEEFHRRNEALRKVAVTAQTFAGTMMPLSRNLNTINYALVAAIGGILTIGGSLTVGALVVFLNLAQQFGRPINEATSQYNAIITAVAGAERIFEVIGERPEEEDGPDSYGLEKEGESFYWSRGEERIPVMGDVRFHNVTFGYVPEKTVLKDLSLFARPGEKIAFVGSTGAGKTTIINLLTRFYEIEEGSITIDGIDLRQIRRDDLRRSMSVVLQDTHLFTGTVRENIRYGNLEAGDEAVEAAARLAGAHSFIRRLPQGYDTLIEGDGANLSQGQRQLLNIARAAVADAPILILDEATSSVDTRTEARIQKGLSRLMEDRTTFVIAHRLSTVRDAEAILVLEQGQVVERGSHQALLEQKGRYYELYTGAAELD